MAATKQNPIKILSFGGVDYHIDAEYLGKYTAQEWDELYDFIKAADNDDVINNIEELLAIFSQYPEGTDIVEALSGKSSSAHTHNYTPAGSVSQPTFSGTAATITSTGTDQAVNVAITSSHPTSGTNYTPQGSIKINQIQPAGTISGSKAFSGTASATSSTAVSAGSGTHTHDVTAKGSISAATTASGSTPTYTPAGTISKPGVSTSATATTTPNSTNKSTTVASSTHTHTLTDAAVSIDTAAVDSSHAVNYTPSGSVSAPSFTGTAATISVSGTPKGSISATATPSGSTSTYTPAGSISAPTPSHTATATATPNSTNKSTTVASSTHTHNVSGNISVSTGTVSTSTPANYTPEGTVSAPTFSGTAATISVSGTPKGSVSTPSFTGTTATIKTSGTPFGSNAAHSHTVTLENNDCSKITA